jgi:predicted ribosome quality control (RQC) complex YloA/Tae2 family protein
LTYCAASTESFTSAQEAVAAFYEPTMQTAQDEDLRREVQKTLRQRQRKLGKKVANLQHDYQKLESYLPYQHYGTLLVAQRLPRGATSVRVVDYYHPDQPTITISLDPRLSVRDNAQVYFKKYRKAKSGLEKVQTLLDQCAAEVHHLEALAQQVERVSSIRRNGSIVRPRVLPRCQRNPIALLCRVTAICSIVAKITTEMRSCCAR